uniref:Bloodthirsty-related gene family, member 1 n=1 Tax=Fundulus heteroclitus TaxID=8078 RepID=A0A3Q2PLX5_FUNHE
MALPSAFLSEDQFTCSICLEMFNNPVSTPCGHSFCQDCLCSYWNGRGRGQGSKSYQCPLCKESFDKRPELHINRTLKEITEQFKQMANPGLQSAGGDGEVEHPSLHAQHQALSPPARPGELPESVFAEMVARRGRGPVMGRNDWGATCPPPYSVNSLPDVPPKKPLCPIHMRGLEFFCRTDNICVCSVCVETAEHRGHSVVPAQREWHIKKSQLGIHGVELKELICERERKVEEIRNSVLEIKVSYQIPMSANYIAACFCQVIETTVQVAESRAQSLLKGLEDEITALKKRNSILSQLVVSEDYVLFFKTFPALATPLQTKDWSNVSVPSQLTSEGILRTINQMMERLEQEMQKLPEVCRFKYKDITLDPSTAHPRLIISADGKQVQCGDLHQPVPNNPERFDRVVCVMAHQGFSSGRHYWEVDVGNKTDWDLGVASRSVIRKGKIPVSPTHGYWFLSLRDRTDYAFRTDPSTNLKVPIRPSRVGIYVDCDKGLVSFYNVEAKLLLYTFTDSFPGTIHPFFSPCTNKSGQNEAPLVICPVAMTD